MKPATKTWEPLAPGSKVTIINIGLALGMEFTESEIEEYREVVEGQWGLDLTHETLEQLGQEDYCAWSGGSPPIITK